MKSLILSAFLLISTLSVGQVLVTPGTAPNPCTTIDIGSTFNFDGSGNPAMNIPSCDLDILIAFYTEENPTFTVAPDEEFLFDTEEFSFTFNDLGYYYFFCGAPPFGPMPVGNAAGQASICYQAVEPIPTLGEWGIIALILLLMIVSVVAVKQWSNVTTKMS